MGTTLEALILFGWIPIVLCLFAVLSERRAVTWSFLAAWMFLPQSSYVFRGLPDYTKMTATSYGVLVATMCWYSNRFAQLRLRWVDVPMLIWCACPAFSSLSNGLGGYDAASSVLYRTIQWGLPYVIGRLYFKSLADVKELASTLVLGGLLYVPLCLYEIRMSPQLHRIVYGFQNDWAPMRYGGWRPTVFMQHGLMVGMWMCMAALVGVWLWHSRLLPRACGGIPSLLAIVALVVTAVLCRSLGAIILLVCGISVYCFARVCKTRTAFWVLLVAGPVYMALRASGVCDGASIVEWSQIYVGEERATSIRTRIKNEDELAAKALERPLLGWGGWSRSFVYDEEGRTNSIPDGLWVIALGTNGCVGLASLYGALLGPAAICALRGTATQWTVSEYAPVAALSVVLVLYSVDCICNAMVNPVFTLVAGALAALCTRGSLSKEGMCAKCCVRRPPARSTCSVRE